MITCFFLVKTIYNLFYVTELHALVTQVPSPTVPLHPIEHSLEKIASSILSVYVAEVPKNKTFDKEAIPPSSQKLLELFIS